MQRWMPDHAPVADPYLVAGRECGSCNVCCVALTIEDPRLHKAQGYRCKHARRDNGCAIYETRPQSCRSFFCGWRRLKWVREALRPDRSDVLVRLNGEFSPEDGQERLAVEFMFLSPTALEAEGIAETIAAAVAARIPVSMSVPGRPGYTYAHARINEPLEEAVKTRNKPAMLAILAEIYALGQSGPRERVTISRKSRSAPPHPAQRGK
jgi:Fe-S-cluster containining protein